MRKKWSPEIPGTDINRMEFLALLIRINKDPMTKKLFRSVAIKEIAEHRVLNAHNIGAVIGCSSQIVHRTLDMLGMTVPSTRGQLTEQALEALYATTSRLARGKQPHADMLEELTLHVSGRLMETLTGVPRMTHHRAKIRRELEPK